MEEKPFMSSLKICPESAAGMGRDGVGGEPLPPSNPPYFPADPWIFHLKVHKIENFLTLILEFALFLC